MLPSCQQKERKVFRNSKIMLIYTHKVKHRKCSFSPRIALKNLFLYKKTPSHKFLVRLLRVDKEPLINLF